MHRKMRQLSQSDGERDEDSIGRDDRAPAQTMQ